MSKFSIVIAFVLSLVVWHSQVYAGDLKDDTAWCERDCKAEYMFFKRYAQQGSSLANLSLAIMNYRGHGRPVNIEAGNNFLDKAARAEEPVAMYQLGYFLLYGLYMEQDLERALVWLKRASLYKIRNSAELVELLEGYFANQHAQASQNLLKDLAKPSQGKLTLSDHDDGVERISVVQSFDWQHALNIAKQQTCKIMKNCGIQWGYMLFPRIKAVNERALIDALSQ